MRDKNHTKGPYKAIPCPDTSGINIRCSSVEGSENIGDYDPIIATIYPNHHYEHVIDRHAANADLLAASYELLLELERTCRDCYRRALSPSFSLSDTYISEQVGKLRQCRGCQTMKTIAKAYGESK